MNLWTLNGICLGSLLAVNLVVYAPQLAHMLPQIVNFFLSEHARDLEQARGGYGVCFIGFDHSKNCGKLDQNSAA